MKKIKLTALILSAAMLLCACSDGPIDATTTAADTAATTTTTAETSGDTTTTTAENSTTTETDTATDTETVTSETTTEAAQTVTAASPEEMLTIEGDDLLSADERLNIIKNSLMTTGDNARLSNALAKAARGEEITVAYIGGSITEGISAGADECWAKLSYNWLCETFPNTTINYINAGLSGTPSYLGVVRCERDILDKGTPDIVFVEFAVNDAQDETSKRMYESLVRGLLELDNQPAVCLLFTVLENGYTCQEHMSAVGEFYGLPMISLTNTLTPAFDNNEIVWTDYSDDQSHPNFWGHKLVAQFAEYLFANVITASDGTEKTVAALPTDTIYNGTFSNVHFVDSLTITPTDIGSFENNTKRIMQSFPNGWHHRGNGTASIKFELEFKDLFLVINCNNTPGYGAADVYIDGVLVENVNASRESGWGNPEAELVYESDAKAKHTVEIIPTEDTQDLFFGLLGFGYTE